ncbi:MAG TPA: hypothetical protein VFL79_04155 [Terriglobia bacterium]|nr:hypothetical protein [Terriglobia bacterium]
MATERAYSPEGLIKRQKQRVAGYNYRGLSGTPFVQNFDTVSQPVQTVNLVYSLRNLSLADA